MSTERPAVPSRLPRLWKSYHPVPAGFSHIFPLLLPAPQLKPQLCKLHDPGAVTPKSFPARGWWPKVMIHGRQGQMKSCMLLSENHLVKLSFDWPLPALHHLGGWLCLCTLSEPLTCHLCHGADVELWPECPARGDGRCPCWESVTVPWACLSPPQHVHRATSVQTEMMRRWKTCERSHGD